MNTKHTFARDSAGRGNRSASFDETLRLIASLPAPAGLEERIHAGLRAAPRKARIFAWPSTFRAEGNWKHSSAMRAAAAAAIVGLVLGGGWGILSHVQVAQPASAIAQPPHLSAPAGFSSAGAMRVPQTLNGPVVTQPPAAQPKPKPAKSIDQR
jgi:hypothetical protein